MSLSLVDHSTETKRKESTIMAKQPRAKYDPADEARKIMMELPLADLQDAVKTRDACKECNITPQSRGKIRRAVLLKRVPSGDIYNGQTDNQPPVMYEFELVSKTIKKLGSVERLEKITSLIKKVRSL